MKSELKLGQMRIPDILETIADLSNDEVFTPPDLANKVLDMLPKEIWSNSTITFLDPACKTGVFLREITKRLIEGLKDEIPDLQERVNHILTKQVYGLGITELTALMSRRTVYCATKANSEASVVTAFDNTEGNIKFPKSKHNFNEKTKKCEICGAGADLYGEIPGLDNYAYSFLHDDLKEVFGNVKFDVIIGNPPYHLTIGENNNASAAIYQNFIDKAIQLNPKYISMIIPSRWMTRTASGIPIEWIDKMISDKRMKEMHDFISSKHCFSSVDIAGGVNYFLWDKDYEGKCNFYQHKTANDFLFKKMYLNTCNSGVLIRDIKAFSVVEKIVEKEGTSYHQDKNFSLLVSPTEFFRHYDLLGKNWKGFSKTKDELHTIKYYTSKHLNGVEYGWIKRKDVIRNPEAISLHKIFLPGTGSSEKFGKVIGEPKYSEPNSVCSATYLIVGYEKKHGFTKEICENVMSYIKTKFFRFMVDLRKTTQSCPRSMYQFVPLQDFSKPWTDAELYKKYKLTPEEIAYIEDNIEEMK